MGIVGALFLGLPTKAIALRKMSALVGEGERGEDLGAILARVSRTIDRCSLYRCITFPDAFSAGSGRFATDPDSRG